MTKGWFARLAPRVFAPIEAALRLGASDRPWSFYLRGLLIFAASRLVVGIGLDLGTLLTPQTNPGLWSAGPAWWDRLLRWDAGWYASIVAKGYQYSQDPTVHSSVVFFPLYPLAAYLTKIALGSDQFVPLLIVANLASLAVALLFLKLAREEFDDEVALLSFAALCFAPGSLFLSAGYSESLALTFVLASFLFLRRDRFALAAAMAGLALATRSTGIVMLPVVLWEVWRRGPRPWAPRLTMLALCAALASSGLVAFMAYLWIAFGDPLAFLTGEQAWHSDPLSHHLIDALKLAPVFRTRIEVAWFVGFFAIILAMWRRLSSPLFLYGLGSLLMPYLTIGITTSVNRYVLMCFPAFLGLGLAYKGRPWLAGSLIGVSSALLCVAAARYSQWYWAG
jgi:Gpi18-like mannosyltransferase